MAVLPEPVPVDKYIIDDDGAIAIDGQRGIPGVIELPRMPEHYRHVEIEAVNEPAAIEVLGDPEFDLLRWPGGVVYPRRFVQRCSEQSLVVRGDGRRWPGPQR